MYCSFIQKSKQNSVYFLNKFLSDSCCFITLLWRVRIGGSALQLPGADPNCCVDFMKDVVVMLVNVLCPSQRNCTLMWQGIEDLLDCQNGITDQAVVAERIWKENKEESWVLQCMLEELSEVCEQFTHQVENWNNPGPRNYSQEFLSFNSLQLLNYSVISHGMFFPSTDNLELFSAKRK